MGSAEGAQGPMEQNSKIVSYAFSGLVLAGLLACGGNSGSTPTPPTTVTPPTTPPNVVTPPPPPTGGTDSNFGTVSLATGFMPDPTIVQGRSGGQRDASTVSAGCNGWIDATKPDHIFNATTAYANLRVLGHSTQDITLVMQKPDGTYLCNDDSEGTDPILVPGAMTPGMYKIWVGSYQQGAYADYHLGFTEISSTTCAQLGN